MSVDSRELHGRSAIYTDVAEIDASNILEVLEKAKQTHGTNTGDITYLYNYYRGTQPILDREKTYNTNVCNKVVVNVAKEITDFKTGYFLSAPIQLVDATTNDAAETVENSDLGRLAKWMSAESKDACDMEIAFWQSVCGVAYRMLDPKDTMPEDDTSAPFSIMTLDPRYTFVVRSSGPHHTPLMGVTYVEDKDGNRTYWCYTDAAVFTIDPKNNVTAEAHQLGRVPIIEYPSGPTRMGDFEAVVPLLDAINTLESGRLDSVEQFVQAIMLLKGVDTGDLAEFLENLREMGGMRLPENGDAKYLSLNMDQSQTQALADNLLAHVRRICGMPKDVRSSSWSTSDTGSAVILRDGWSATEAIARGTETWFRKSERMFLDMAIDFCNLAGGLDLRHQDVDIRFPRRNYTNDSANVDNLIKMLSSEWITPEQAFEHSNMFPDSHTEFLKAKAWHDSREAETVNALTDTTEEIEV